MAFSRGLSDALVTPGVKALAVEQLPLASQSASQRWLKRLASRRLGAHVAVGERAARIAAEQWIAEGRKVQIALPPVPGSDWNDVLLGKDRYEQKCYRNKARSFLLQHMYPKARTIYEEVLDERPLEWAQIGLGQCML